MKNFFAVVLLVTVSIIILIIYYTSKNFYLRYKERVVKLRSVKKSYEDEKKYIRQYIRKILGDLQTGERNWILISSRLYPETKIELTYNFIEQCLQIKHRIRAIDNEEMNVLKNLGLQTYNINNDLFCINVSLNSVIVTDIVYFLLERIGEQGNAQHIKIVTSGG